MVPHYFAQSSTSSNSPESKAAESRPLESENETHRKSGMSADRIRVGGAKDGKMKIGGIRVGKRESKSRIDQDFWRGGRRGQRGEALAGGGVMDDQTRKSPPPSQQRERRFLLFARTRFCLSEFCFSPDRASIFSVSAFRFQHFACPADICYLRLTYEGRQA